MSGSYYDSIFWIEVEKIKPNPYQPRRDFDQARLQELAESIRQYGVLQPIVVSRQEVIRDDGIAVEYELIAGERRWRAAGLAGISQVPAVIRVDDDPKMKLELAIIENLQREDLNSVDRARAFERLANEFNFTHLEIGRKVGKSREYVSNTIRILALPEDVLCALAEGKIMEGHTRPLLMLTDRPEDQRSFFERMISGNLNVREAELAARGIAVDRARKPAPPPPDPEIVELEKRLAETLGTRVKIEKKEDGGQIKIDFFSPEDLKTILLTLSNPSSVAETAKEKPVSSNEDDLYNLENFNV